jgi:hypothetical protein
MRLRCKEYAGMADPKRLGAAGAVLVALLLGLGSLAANSASDQPGAVSSSERSAWKHHHATFSYYGLTSLYTCDGLEDKVKQILLYLGARKGVQVQASCARGPNAPSHQAWVTVDFDALQAAPDSPDADSVQAHWAATQVAPRRPRFMEDGDCELIDDLRAVLKDGFSWRGLDYRASCVPHNLELGGFEVRGEVLQPAAPAPAH